MILTQATDQQLTAAVEENLYDLFRGMVNVLPDSELEETGNFSRHRTFPLNPMFNGIWNTRSDSDETIQACLDWYKARNASYVFWWFSTRNPVSLDRLKAHGFVENVAGDPGMAADLHQLNETISVPDGFEIIKVAGQKALEDWRDVFVASFGVPPFAGQSWVDATLSAGFESAPWQLYLGYLNGKPVATNMLVYGGGAAGLYGVGTVPEVRGKGIGAAITLKPLLDAREDGYHYGVLFATQMGYPVYQKLGFRDLGSMIGRYMWINPA